MRRMTCSSGRERLGLVVRKFRLFDRTLEPSEQLSVEVAVQFLGVERVQPGEEQTVKVVWFAVDVHPRQPFGQRKFLEDVQVGAMGVGGINFTNQRDAAEYVSIWVKLVRAAMDEGQAEPAVGSSEKYDGGLQTDAC